MSKKNYLYILIILYIIISISPSISAENRDFDNPNYLVSASKLNSRIKDNNLVIIDVRQSGQYVLGHIPGAVNMWGEDFTQINGWIEGLIPQANYFSFICQKKGINNSSEIVLYDNKTGLWASRLWLIFKFYGHDNVKILEGGLENWKNSGFKTDIFANLPEKNGNFYVKNVKNNWLIKSQSIALNLKNNDLFLIDTRSEEEYSGNTIKRKDIIKGHIPGSVNVEWNEVINEDGFLKNSEKIKAIYRKKGVLDNDKTIILISNTAVRASHTFFVLNLIGCDNLKLYDDSYLGWSRLKGLKIQKNTSK